MRQTLRVTTLAVAGVLTAFPCYAVEIVIDYRHDSFFASNSTAKAALEAAAADLSDVILTSLNSTTDTSSGSSGGATATFNFERVYVNPTSGSDETLSSAAVPADQVRVFVGVRPMASDALGVATPGYFDASSSGTSVSGSVANRPQAVANAAAAGSSNLGRGAGPTINTINGSLGGTSFSIDFGAALGSTWFDVDTDNNGVTDSGAVLDAYWHFDHTTPVAAGKADFYSVALHELVHILGFGSSLTWDDNVSSADSRDWLGPEVIALAGSGDNMLTPDSHHIASGKISVRLTGSFQEAAMDPTLNFGVRKRLTILDLAFLRDIGWETVSLDLTGDLNDDGIVNALDIDILWNVIRPEVAGSNDPGANDDEDLNGDGFVNEDDVDFLLANLLTSGNNRRYGDADLDGGVGGIDFTRWRERAGTGWQHGDFDGDGGVGGLDFTLWRTRPSIYPGTVGPHSGSPIGVPEPASMGLLILGLAVLAAHRGRLLSGSSRVRPLRGA